MMMDFIILLKFGFVAVRDHSSSKVNLGFSSEHLFNPALAFSDSL